MKENTEHRDGQESMGKLDQIDRNGPFYTPNNYFEQLESRLEDLIQDPEATSPVLDKIGKEQVFTTPPDYFEGVWNKFEQKLAENHHSRKGKIRTLNARPLYILGAVAAIALLLFFFVNPAVEQDPLSPSFAELEHVPIEDLIAAVEPEELDLDVILAEVDRDVLANIADSETDLELSSDQEESEYEEFLDDLDVYMLEDEFNELEQGYEEVLEN